jgi:D-alanyl-lipoteichoic acid acyltransferase DltB (MBOAT superfamily)
MLFLSLPFLLFLPVFFLLYWYVFGGSLRAQNGLVLVGSYILYCWWDWRFLFLLVGSSALNYGLGLLLTRTDREGYRGLLVGIGLVQGLGCLLYFKYFNSFLPLGISFYTFKTISYLVDIRRGKIKPERDWVVFFSYVAFFPCVLSGPIDRPGVLLPQLSARREFRAEQGVDGLRQILWGLFKKVVIADNCSLLTGDIFGHYATQSVSGLLFGVFLYTIQIYADFSGYSDMAIGIGSLLGFRITRNFRYPFFSQNIAEFWRRWHITLTSWLTEYVYLPLSIYFRDYGRLGQIAVILVNFALIGIWHGPKWTFLVFGILHGCYYIPLILRGTLNKKGGTGGIKMVGTFLLVMLTYVVFRAESLGEAIGYYRRMLSGPVFGRLVVGDKTTLEVMLGSIVLMFGMEWWQRDREHPLQLDRVRSFGLRVCIYYFFLGLVLCFGPAKFTEFIYIRF